MSYRYRVVQGVRWFAAAGRPRHPQREEHPQQPGGGRRGGQTALSQVLSQEEKLHTKLAFRTK